MKFVYLPFLAVLLWTYWCALKRVRDERTPFTPIMGWLVGLGYFVMAPLTIQKTFEQKRPLKERELLTGVHGFPS